MITLAGSLIINDHPSDPPHMSVASWLLHCNAFPFQDKLLNRQIYCYSKKKKTKQDKTKNKPTTAKPVSTLEITDRSTDVGSPHDPAVQWLTNKLTTDSPKTCKTAANTCIGNPAPSPISADGLKSEGSPATWISAGTKAC